MNQRKHNRFNVELLVSFSSEEFEGEGRVVDLSYGGCAMHSNTPARTGDFLTLFIMLPTGIMPITVGVAAVRWANSSRQGIEFIRMGPDQQNRLRAFLLNCELACRPTEQSSTNAPLKAQPE